MIYIYIGLILFGIFSFWMFEELLKTKRELTSFDLWDNLLWKIGMFLGVCGVIGIVIELLKFILSK